MPSGAPLQGSSRWSPAGPRPQAGERSGVVSSTEASWSLTGWPLRHSKGRRDGRAPAKLPQWSRSLGGGSSQEQNWGAQETQQESPEDLLLLPSCLAPNTQALTLLVPWYGARAHRLYGAHAHRLQHEGPSGVGGARVHPEILPAGQDLTLMAVLAKAQPLKRLFSGRPLSRPKAQAHTCTEGCCSSPFRQGPPGPWARGGR